MQTNDYLELVKRKLDLQSDQALANVLGVTRSAISHMKSGKSGIGDATAVKVAQLTGIPVARVLIDVHLERSKAPEVKAAWASMMEKFPAPTDLHMPYRSQHLNFLPSFQTGGPPQDRQSQMNWLTSEWL